MRDADSRYRLYDSGQVLRLHVVALLRQHGYQFDAIRGLLDEVAAGRPTATLSALERRSEELGFSGTFDTAGEVASRHCRGVATSAAKGETRVLAGGM